MLAEQSRTEKMARGYSGTSRTIDQMHRLVEKAKLDPTMHRIATWIRAEVPGDARGSTRATADAVFRWVAKHGLFQRDQFQIERIEHPISSMQSLVAARKAGINTHGKLFAGDCDQFAIWVAALGGILGFQYAFETSKSDLSRPDEFSHVWPALLVGRDWVAYDASTPGASPNWRPPIPTPDKFKRWPEKPIEDISMHGLGEEEAPFAVPEDYFGYGIEHNNDGLTPSMVDTDPGRLDMLVPEQPAVSAAELTGKFPGIGRIPTPDPSFRPSLVPTFQTGPQYVDKPKGYYNVVRRRYPKNSPWNRIAVSDEDRAPIRKGYPRILNSRSTVPSVDVIPSMTGPVTVTKENGDMNVVRRPGLKSTVIVQRPAYTPAGMGEEDWRASLVTDINQPAAQAAGASVLDSILKTVTDVAKVAAPVVAQSQLAKVNQNYQGLVAGAVNTVAGQQLVTAQSIGATRIGGIAITAPGQPIYKQPWLWMGLSVIVAGGAAVMLLRGGKRRRRGRR